MRARAIGTGSTAINSCQNRHPGTSPKDLMVRRQLSTMTASVWTDAGLARRPGRAAWRSTSCTSAPSPPRARSRGVESRLGATSPTSASPRIELMPVAEFAGDRNWGYDGVDLFAPSHDYGTPDDLRRLVDAAHAHGLGVHPRRRLQPLRARRRLPPRVQPALPHDRATRRPGAPASTSTASTATPSAQFFIENALHWVHEYHVDGLRLDATPRAASTTAAAALSRRARRAGPRRVAGRTRHPHRRGRAQPRDADSGAERRAATGSTASGPTTSTTTCVGALAGDDEATTADYPGTVARHRRRRFSQGWFFTRPALASTSDAPRGTDPAGLPPRGSSSACRTTIRSATARSATGCTIRSTSPSTAPLRRCCCSRRRRRCCSWARSGPRPPRSCTSPTTNRRSAAVTEGRRAEFAAFSAFADPATRDRIPDPQDVQTFRASQLEWEERHQPSHAAVLRLYRALLHARREFWCRLLVERRPSQRWTRRPSR